jgi:tetratricopeptide (TPR) repeat protein
VRLARPIVGCLVALCVCVLVAEPAHAVLVSGLGATYAEQERATVDASYWQRIEAFEKAIAGDPENLKLAADYRQLVIMGGEFDRSIDFLERLAKQKGSGPDVRISLALAYVDKVPTSGDLRRLYLGRDAMNALTRSIEQKPSVLAYSVRGLINLFYNTFIFRRTDKGIADLKQALALATADTPPMLLARVYVALGDGYFRLDDLAKANETWSAGLAKCPEDAALKLRLSTQGRQLAVAVSTALDARRRIDTSLNEMLPIR